MELGAGMDLLAEKAVKDRRRRRAVKAPVMEAQSNFDRVRHSPPSPLSMANPKSKGKALKDGWDAQECQG
jgi:hypothetical protein